jgi:hypothetical protein
MAKGIKFEELEGEELDTLVRGLTGAWGQLFLHPSTNWMHGGPIIEEHKIAVSPTARAGWYARIGPASLGIETEGPTPLIAAMRCYVKSKLGASKA